MPRLLDRFASLPAMTKKKKGRDRSRPFVFASLVMCEAYFASARFGGVAGHDLTSVS